MDLAESRRVRVATDRLVYVRGEVEAELWTTRPAAGDNRDRRTTPRSVATHALVREHGSSLAALITCNS